MWLTIYSPLMSQILLFFINSEDFLDPVAVCSWQCLDILSVYPEPLRLTKEIHWPGCIFGNTDLGDAHEVVWLSPRIDQPRLQSWFLWKPLPNERLDTSSPQEREVGVQTWEGSLFPLLFHSLGVPKVSCTMLHDLPQPHLR